MDASVPFQPLFCELVYDVPPCGHMGPFDARCLSWKMKPDTVRGRCCFRGAGVPLVRSIDAGYCKHTIRWLSRSRQEAVLIHIAKP